MLPFRVGVLVCSHKRVWTNTSTGIFCVTLYKEKVCVGVIDPLIQKSRSPLKVQVVS